MKFQNPILKFVFKKKILTHSYQGAQWLSGRVLDSRLRVQASPASLRCGP